MAQENLWPLGTSLYVSLQKWRPPLTLRINYMIHTHPWRNFFPPLQFHSIILRYWTSLTHTGTIMIFMLLLKRWKSKFTTLSREMLCCWLNSQACLMQRNSSVSPFVIFNHRLEPQKFGLWNNNLYKPRAGIRNQSFCYAMLCFAVWVGSLFQIFCCFGKQSHT